jgi:hypothetical protein
MSALQLLADELQERSCHVLWSNSVEQTMQPIPLNQKLPWRFLNK